MDEKIYTIILSDGTKLSNLHLNGNNFVSQAEITEDMFSGKLKRVIISDGETEQVLNRAELIQIAHYADGWYFILREIPADVMELEIINAKIDYLAMMTDVEL